MLFYARMRREEAQRFSVFELCPRPRMLLRVSSIAHSARERAPQYPDVVRATAKFELD
jgi:hypothetical protein